MYRILLRCTACVQPLSCDEAFLDVTGACVPPLSFPAFLGIPPLGPLLHGPSKKPLQPTCPGLGDPDQLAGRLRSEIAAATGCTASTGIGPSLLLARIATKVGAAGAVGQSRG